MRSSRAWIALAVLVLVPAAFLGLFALLGALAFALLDGGGSGSGARLLLYLLVPVILIAVLGVLGLAKAKPRRVEGVEISREAHPSLWAEFNQSARSARTARADRAVITLDVNAAVRQVSGNRELIIGLPLLATLTVPQLRAVLAHEFGHFGSGHTRISAWTWRANSTLAQIADRSKGITGLPLRLYARLYAAAAAASSRDQEWQADEYAARLATPAVGAAALRRVAETQLGWEWLSTRFLPLAGPAERRPPLVEGLRAVMAANAGLLESSVKHILDSESTGIWSSSHPPMKERIARFEQWAGYPVVGGDAGEPASTLLTGGEAAFGPIEVALTGNESAPASWEEVVRRAGTAVVTEEGNALLRASTQVLQAKHPDLDTLLGVVGRGEGLELVGSLVDPEVPRSQRQRAEHEVLIHTLSSVIAAELVTAGRAHHELDWTVMWRFVDNQGTLLPIEAEVAAAVAEPSRIPQLRSRLRELGITSLSQTQIVATAGSQRVPVGVISRVAAPQTEEEVDLLVFDDGLLLVPVTTPVSASKRTRTKDENDRLDGAYAGTFREWRARPGAGWLDEQDITGAELSAKPWAVTLHLSDGGDPIVLQGTVGTVQRGSAVDALGSMLGSRLRA